MLLFFKTTFSTQLPLLGKNKFHQYILQVQLKQGKFEIIN
jgi:hypothetical protein